MLLHDYFRSTASWRVRIALHMKGVLVQQVPHHLRRNEHLDPGYLRFNPQGLVPALETDHGAVLTQSLAICEWLEEVYPEPPLLPPYPLERARVRAFALAICCDIHPVQNLKVLERLKALGHEEAVVTGWARKTIEEGLAACEALIATIPGPFCFRATPSLADICLVPQLANAARFGCDLSAMPRLRSAAAACASVPAFLAAAPERQPDAE